MPISVIESFEDGELEKKRLIERIIEARRASLRKELGALRPSELMRRAREAGTRRAESVVRRACSAVRAVC